MDCGTCQKNDCDIIFKDLAPQDLLAVARSKVTNRYRKGQNVNIQGNPVFGVYCISSGKLKISTTCPETGKETIFRICGPGDIVGFRALFANELMQATITALVPSEVCFFSKDEVQRILKRYPEVTLQLVRKMGQMLGAAERTIASLTQQSVKQRYAHLLLSLQHSHGDDLENRINVKLTREEVASIIGTTSETVTRLTTEFKKGRLIDMRDKYYFILDKSGLTALAEGGLPKLDRDAGFFSSRTFEYFQ